MKIFFLIFILISIFFMVYSAFDIINQGIKYIKYGKIFRKEGRDYISVGLLTLVETVLIIIFTIHEVVN